MPKKIVISRFEYGVNLVDFDCGDEQLNKYIKNFATQDIKRNISAVYTAKIGENLIGFYSISATSVAATDLPNNIAKKLPKYPVPSAIIGRLAVDEKYQNNGLGSALIIDAIKRIIRSSELIGIYAIIVDAKNEPAKKFYEHYGFCPLQNKDMRLFLPLQTAINLFSH